MLTADPPENGWGRCSRIFFNVLPIFLMCNIIWPGCSGSNINIYEKYVGDIICLPNSTKWRAKEKFKTFDFKDYIPPYCTCILSRSVLCILYGSVSNGYFYNDIDNGFRIMTGLVGRRVIHANLLWLYYQLHFCIKYRKSSVLNHSFVWQTVFPPGLSFQKGRSWYQQLSHDMIHLVTSKAAMVCFIALFLMVRSLFLNWDLTDTQVPNDVLAIQPNPLPVGSWMLCFSSFLSAPRTAPHSAPPSPDRAPFPGFLSDSPSAILEIAGGTGALLSWSWISRLAAPRRASRCHRRAAPAANERGATKVRCAETVAARDDMLAKVCSAPRKRPFQRVVLHQLRNEPPRRTYRSECM